MNDRAHWFDELSVRFTRRGALKAGLVAAAAVTLPFTRTPSPALADLHTDPCYRGCGRFAAEQFGNAVETCQELNEAHTVTGIVGWATAVLVAPAAGIPVNLASVLHRNASFQSCMDNALITKKVAVYDCIKPNCSGFDPKQPGGPCETCTENCCVCPGVSSGYICCFYECEDPNHNCCG